MQHGEYPDKPLVVGPAFAAVSTGMGPASASHREGGGIVAVLHRDMNKKNFANKIHLFTNFRRFFAKWGLFFAKWGLLFARLDVRKSPAVLLNLGHPIAPLHFVCAI